MAPPGPEALNRSGVLALLASAGLRPSSSRGQNFLTDDNTARRVARRSEAGEGDSVIEIGAGLGSLTRALVATGAEVVAVEIDPGLAEIAAGVATGARVVVADAMRLDYEDLLRASERWLMVSNLPYNVAAPLVMRVLESVPRIWRLLVMVQREVGERMVAVPGDQAYGGLSVKASYFCVRRLAGSVPPTVFVPKPKVESVLVELERRGRPAYPPERASYRQIAALVDAGFAQRRKMLRRSLVTRVDGPAFEAAGVEGTARAEELSIEQWGRLAECAATAW